jgi:hypothetical protein
MGQDGTFSGGSCSQGLSTLATFGYDLLDHLSDVSVRPRFQLPTFLQPRRQRRFCDFLNRMDRL